MIRSNDGEHQTLANIAKAFEEATVDTILIKCRRVLKQSGHRRLVMAVGVAASKRLRTTFEAVSKKNGREVYQTSCKYSTDNGDMIAYASCRRLLAGERTYLGEKPMPRCTLCSSTALQMATKADA